jgi:hypothetical protein
LLVKFLFIFLQLKQLVVFVLFLQQLVLFFE